MNEFKFQLELTKAFERPTGYFNKETGEPETRKYIAEKLLESAGRGETTLGQLNAIARRAVRDLARRRSA